MKTITYLTVLFTMIALTGCGSRGSEDSSALLERENLIAWCIVPFDANKRTPEERALMLRDLGITHFAYDYREEHIPSFAHEIQVLRESGIGLSAVWFWIEPGGDTLLNPANRAILKVLEETGTNTTLWVSFPGQFFEGLTDDRCVEKAVGTLRHLLTWTDAHGCTIALYNHGDWFGEPGNQIRIIEAIGSPHVSMVYNFHHGHHQVERFGELFQAMLPYLSAININGMKVEGPKIITLGEGDRELEMLRIIMASDYEGPIGILGHTDGEDIRVVLERNLKGLEKLKGSL